MPVIEAWRCGFGFRFPASQLAHRRLPPSAAGDGRCAQNTRLVIAVLFSLAPSLYEPPVRANALGSPPRAAGGVAMIQTFRGFAPLIVILFACDGRDAGRSNPRDAGALGGDAASTVITVDGSVVEVPLAHTALGTLEGTYAGSTREFLGIPYAEPPLGALRFAPPQPIAAWSSPRSAATFAPACPQPASLLSDPNQTDEDCLYLNVFTPAQVDKPLPVLVFIHGGAFMRGGADQHDGSQLSAAWSVVV
ncbi:MAG TPA: carboxylesterase family protein, partial [Polyangiales bacterium]